LKHEIKKIDNFKKIYQEKKITIKIIRIKLVGKKLKKDEIAKKKNF
jgi:hypothetical protein